MSDDELERRVRALEAERLRPTPPPPDSVAAIRWRRFELLMAVKADDAGDPRDRYGRKR